MRTALNKYFATAAVMAMAAPSTYAAISPPTEEPNEDPKPVESLNVQGVLDLMIDIAQILIAFVAVISIIMVIWGGFVYATSRGDTTKTASARSTITYGVIGLVVALLAFAVVSFANSIVSGNF